MLEVGVKAGCFHGTLFPISLVGLEKSKGEGVGVEEVHTLLEQDVRM